MELDLIREDMKKLLKASRYLHSVGVEEVSHDLALIYGYNINHAKTAGILHDCAKYLSDEELLKACEMYHLPVTEIERECAFLLHAKVGAAFAKSKYGVEDEEILSAIAYHTTGRPAMTLLEKIIFTADYIEPYRKPLPRIEDIRKAAYNDLDLAVYMILENVLNYLSNNNSKIDNLTKETYEYYKKILSIQ
ncbi:MAG: bis(5'-nucleosyl)-tetraphosphatase (symmetrical) YqeK [Herbinix sp.]|nr:bis(5'-nucleosyl)-tetraphosphatase (symmetrical) YqeK [Herbinix sp.]